MKERENSRRWVFGLVFALSLVYMETVFRIAAIGSLLHMGYVYTILFSLAYGSVGYLLSSMFRKEWVNRLIASLLLLGTSLAYIVQFLIYKQFKQFYDINTMTGGAGDALTSYFAELIDLIFAQGGIVVVLLLLLPVVVYLVLGKVIGSRQATWKGRGFTVLGALLIYGLNLALLLTNPLSAPVYYSQYSFQSAVPGFGLITALRLDVQDHLFEKSYSFETPQIPVVTEPAQTTAPTETVEKTTEPTETTEPPVVYHDHILDIDFEVLNNSATSKQKELNAYVSSLTPTKENEYTGLFRGKNLVMISAEAFSAELIDPILTPTLYRLATKGIQFTDYYQPASAGTTGGEYQNIFSMLPTAGGKSFKNTADNLNYFTMGSQLDRLGYYGKAFHNNSYTYYDRNLTHTNLGYSDGFMGYGNGMEEYVTKSWPQSDYEMFTGTVPTFIDKQPFNVYYMTVSGHSNYTPMGNNMTAKHWDRVADLNCSDTIKGYIAANLDLEDALTYLVEALEKAGIADDTVICISTDHFPYGLDSDATLGNMPYLSELYGCWVEDYFGRDHSRLILWSGCLEKMEPIIVDTPTSSLDILPTLSNLFGTEFDSRLFVGRDVFSDAPALVFNTAYDWKTELGTYYASRGEFVPVSENTVIPEGYVDAIKATVRNKMTYCAGVLDTDYFRLLFEE